MSKNSARAGWRLMRAVAEVHLRGYQRLRICPAVAPSGMHWRCTITSVTQVSSTNGALVAAWREHDPHYSTGQGWDFAGEARLLERPVAKIADAILSTYPHLQDEGRGRDWAYAGWLGEVLARCWPDALPYAMQDGPLGTDGTLPCTRRDGRGFELPMPPPGEHDGRKG